MASRSQTPGGVTASTTRTRTRKSAVEPDESVQTATTIPDDMRRQWVAEAAYFIAEKRGFDPQYDTENWEEATRQVDAELARHGGA